MIAGAIFRSARFDYGSERRVEFVAVSHLDATRFFLGDEILQSPRFQYLS